MTLRLSADIQTYDDNKSIVKVDSVNYKTFVSFSVSRSIDNVCGDFKIVLSRPEKSVSPFKVGDVIDILLDGFQAMRGKIYQTSFEGDATTDNIILAGRDITGDLIDSTVPDTAKVYEAGANIFSIAGSVIQALGLQDLIQVVNQTGGAIEPFAQDEIISCDTGTTAIGFLLKYCRKRQLFLNTDNNGNLIFFKAEGIKTGNRIINDLENNNNNVISWKNKYNISERFFKYTCKSQDAALWGGTEVNAVGVAIDTEVSPVRQYEFRIEEGAVDDTECKARAAEEANVRRARAFEYTPTVQGFKDKTVWGINQFVSVSDERCDITGEFLVKGVEYSLDNQKGRTAKLTIVNRDAYTAEAAISQRTANLSAAGKKWFSAAVDAVRAAIVAEGASD